MRRGGQRRVAGAVGAALLVGAGSYPLMNSTSYQLFGGLTHRVETSRKVVALTFDDGPTCSDVDGVLAATKGVPVTYFLIGKDVAQCPDGARRLVASGAQVGNHTWDHHRMVLVGPGTVAREIEPTDRVIRAAGYRGEIMFRPPYGKKLIVLPWWLHQHHRRTITWDVAVETWDTTPQDAQAIARQTVARVRPGSIILLHPWNGRRATQRAIPLVVQQLRDEGYTFVRVQDLIDG